MYDGGIFVLLACAYLRIQYSHIIHIRRPAHSIGVEWFRPKWARWVFIICSQESFLHQELTVDKYNDHTNYINLAVNNQTRHAIKALIRTNIQPQSITITAAITKVTTRIEEINNNDRWIKVCNNGVSKIDGIGLWPVGKEVYHANYIDKYVFGV